MEGFEFKHQYAPFLSPECSLWDLLIAVGLNKYVVSMSTSFQQGPYLEYFEGGQARVRFDFPQDVTLSEIVRMFEVLGEKSSLSLGSPHQCFPARLIQVWRPEFARSAKPPRKFAPPFHWKWRFHQDMCSDSDMIYCPEWGESIKSFIQGCPKERGLSFEVSFLSRIRVFPKYAVHLTYQRHEESIAATGIRVARSRSVHPESWRPVGAYSIVSESADDIPFSALMEFAQHDELDNFSGGARDGEVVAFAITNLDKYQMYFDHCYQGTVRNEAPNATYCYSLTPISHQDVRYLGPIRRD